MSTFNSVDSLQSQFQIGKLLGTTGSLGAFVHLAKYKKNGKWVAIKKYNEGGLEGTIETRAEEDAAHYIQHEVTMMKLLCHENILKCVSSIVVDSQIWIVTPLMVYGSVSNLLKEHFQEGLSELACCFIIKDLLHALQYIHDQGVVHRSVRCSHLLINESGRCVLTGFRYSTPLNAIGDQSSTLYDYPLHCITSNLEWLAPEILKQNLLGYSETSDIYSLGVVACEMANGIVPFSDFPATLMFIEKLNGSSPRLMDFNTINAAKQVIITGLPTE
ncbi:STE20-related kinase adapter protein alpha, partial [Eurytemora carolleeae]|uniref:STE20-related kinase adapter protein alpha n=1 Tax=Eurytemora carolleeae TaxID=1294199 RepID=UPI000C77C6F6